MDPLQFLLWGGIAVVAIVLIGFFWAKGRRSPLLESRRFFFSFQVVLANAPERDGVVGVWMDINVQGNRSAVVCMADGAASLYWSSGAVIGAGTHPEVQSKSNEFLSKVGRCLNVMEEPPNHDFPQSMKIRLFALTKSGIRFVEAHGEVQPTDTSPVSLALLAGNEVIDAIASKMETMAAERRQNVTD